MVQESGGVSIGGDAKGIIVGQDVENSNLTYTEQVGTPSETEQATVKDAIAKVEQTIKADKRLNEREKQKLLEQVTVLAKAIEQPEVKENQNKAKEAKNKLSGIISILPEAAKAVAAVSNLFPLIAKFFGFTE